MEQQRAAIVHIAETLMSQLDLLNDARERALTVTRQITRLSANAVRATHRGERDVARSLLAEAGSLKDTLTVELQAFPVLYWSGYVQDAYKEYAEAHITAALIAGDPVPTPEALGVEPAVYLNALGEAAGELRRYILDCIRLGELTRAEQALAIMDEIYGMLVQVDYPDAVTNGLRRTTDMVRGVLERTRGDLTLAVEQQKLSEALARAQEVLQRTLTSAK